MSKLKLTIITPSYNQGRFIESTIKSVMNQNIPIQYLIMDGGSKDNTKNVLESYKNKYQDSLSYIMEPDNGQAHAVNKGLARATGDIIGWVNSDDCYMPGAFEKVLDFFDKNPSVDVLYGDKIFIDINNKPINFYPVEKMSLRRLKQTCIIPQPATFFRRKIVDSHGMLNENLNFCMDYEFWLRLALAKVKFSYIKKTLAIARVYDDCKTVASSLSAHKERMGMLYSKLNYYPAQPVFAYANAIVASKKCNSSFGKICVGTNLLKEWVRLVRTLKLKRGDRVGCYFKTPIEILKYTYIRLVAKIKFLIMRNKFNSIWEVDLKAPILNIKRQNPP